MKKTVEVNNKIKELEKKVEELTNNWKRALADYQNLQKRVEEEKKNWLQVVNKNIIEKLLPVIDTLEQASIHLKDQGLALALKQFKNVLKNEGVVEIEALGKTFDPTIHDCVDTEEGEEENKISHVFTKGYKLNGIVLRPSQVRVIKKKVSEKEEELAKKATQTGDYM